jgi:hypothetical protein
VLPGDVFGKSSPLVEFLVVLTEVVTIQRKGKSVQIVKIVSPPTHETAQRLAGQFFRCSGALRTRRRLLTTAIAHLS